MTSQNIKQANAYRPKPALEIPHFRCGPDRGFQQMQREHRAVLMTLSKKLHRSGVRLVRDEQGNKRIASPFNGSFITLDKETLQGYCQDRFTCVGDPGSFVNIYDFLINNRASMLQFVDEQPRQGAIARLWTALASVLRRFRSIHVWRRA